MRIMSKSKKIPEFKDENEEREFWAKADSTKYIDWHKGKKNSISEFKTINKNHIFTSA